ncbi:hypothetical protein QR680_018831 [Steinernema hermaphroditum]|uniref:Telomeric single stranded DNA binding POT1/Cdc13 domain-containing protein n=1 Tax=Steinernema hermaphroditum TaxID=289476 RepID=A0AA39HJ46_9BILA|nr:hypothetical protein QR680_018831 [Steinernema hermaphroditum]
MSSKKRQNKNGSTPVYFYTKLGEIDDEVLNGTLNIYGIVADEVGLSHPDSPRTYSIKLVDETCVSNPVLVTLSAEEGELTAPRIGNIIRVHRIRGHKDAPSNTVILKGTAKVAGLHLCIFDGRENEPFEPLFLTSKTFTFAPEDERRVAELREFARPFNPSDRSDSGGSGPMEKDEHEIDEVGTEEAHQEDAHIEDANMGLEEVHPEDTDMGLEEAHAEGTDVGLEDASQEDANVELGDAHAEDTDMGLEDAIQEDAHPDDVNMRLEEAHTEDANMGLEEAHPEEEYGLQEVITTEHFERFERKTHMKQNMALSIERGMWFFEAEKLKNASEGHRFSIIQPVTVTFSGHIWLMKHCSGDNCDFKIVHQPFDAASKIGRCVNCCGWRPQEHDESTTALIPQYKLVCWKTIPTEGAKQTVNFLLPQDVANACVAENHRIPYKTMAETLDDRNTDTLLSQFREEVANSLEVSRIQMTECTLIYNRPGEPLVVDVHSAEILA